LRHVREFSYLHVKELLGVFKETVNDWVNDRAPRLGASLAFYTLLSLAPLLVVIVGVAGMVYGREAAQGQLVWQIQGLVGSDGARAIQGLVQDAYKPGAGVIATLLGFLTLAFGASSVVVELRDALNTIWHVPLDRGGTGFSSIFRLGAFLFLRHDIGRRFSAPGFSGAQCLDRRHGEILYFDPPNSRTTTPCRDFCDLVFRDHLLVCGDLQNASRR